MGLAFFPILRDMMRTLLTLCLSLLSGAALLADPGDTTIVQTFTFEDQLDQEGAYKSPGRRWFQFPEDDGTSYQKILMYHTLKCFDDGLTAGGLGFPCGEWDYLTYNYLFDHTGVLDSAALTHPLYLWNNAAFEEINPTAQALFNQRVYEFASAANSSVSNAQTHLLGNAEQGSLEAINTAVQRSRFQTLITADELMDAGLTAGFIGELQLQIGMAGQADHLRLRIATTESTELTEWVDAGSFTSVFEGPFIAEENSTATLTFHEAYEWDGSSHLVLELSSLSNELYSATEVLGDNSGQSLIILGDENDRYLEVDGNDQVKVPAALFESISDEVTIAFWCYGDPNAQPENGTIFEGVNAQNQRVLNSHLPWGNGRVYWDAGQSGGYDRIDEQAQAEDYSGQWNHWTFTKNATTGVMNIYLNGVLWHSGSDRTRSMEGVVNFSIGSAAGWSNFYRGRIDDFSIWNTVLEEEVIAQYRFSGVDDNHPAYGNLLAFYTFNEANGSAVTDHSPNQFEALVYGNADRVLYSPEERFLRVATSDFRPAMQLTSGDFDIEVETAQFIETLPIAPSSLSEWEVQGNGVVLANLDFFWEPQETYLFNEAGDVLEVFPFEGETVSYTNETLNYFGAPFEVIDRYELGRYITPYGIGLTLDDDGWTWVFDVTDYAPLLQGEVELEAGNWQELLDLKFVFIEGTPPREVKRVEAFWKGQYNLNTFDEQVVGHTFTPQEGEETFRLKTRASGHGFGQGNNCAEFCFNIHSVKVNGETQWSWQIMQECADNPLYPQGGTWIYDRAGWCPGDKVTTQNFELSPLVNANEPFEVDYDITFDPFGNYRMEGQIIAYGGLNFQNDVELMEIISPSSWKIHSRANPVCNKAKIRIRNNGANDLTSCTISYGIDGQMQTHEWTGNLAFMESEEVELTYSNPDYWSGEDEEETLIFEVTVNNPNGTEDENPSNSYGTSSFVRPPVFAYSDLNDNRLIVMVTTNNSPWETSATLETMNGTEIFASDYGSATTAYRDTLTLNEGCYKFHLRDTDDDGLSFFANNDGNGQARLRRVAGGNFVQFDPDFGKEVIQYFYFKTNIVSVEEHVVPSPSLQLFPNPANDFLHLRVSDWDAALEWRVFDLNGRMLKEGQSRRGEEQLTVDLSDLPSGMYHLQLSDGRVFRSARFVKAG